MSVKIRKVALLGFGPLLIAAIGGWFYMHGGRYVETNNAYVKADKVSISSELSGKATQVFAKDHQQVEMGQVLFTVDDHTFRIAVSHAEAHLASVRGDIESMKADYRNKLAEHDSALTARDFYIREYDRINRLLKSGSVAGAQADQARFQKEHAEKAVNSAWEAAQLVKARLIDPDMDTESHPDFLLASAELEKARLDLERTRIRAPLSGVIANFDMQPGEYINAGLPLFSIISDQHVWVEANFKETDLTNLVPGQSATIRIDTYPDQELTGVVTSLTPGTGSEFSLLPAQNSSGNWVKVVQRISVEIELEAEQDAPSLTAGMSAVVKVDTERQRQLPWISSK